MQTHQLINIIPRRSTPMEENQENLEVLVTMLMLVAHINQEPEALIRETYTTAAAALQNPAEA